MRSAASLSLYLLLLCLFCIATISFGQSGPPAPKATARISVAEAEDRLTKKVDPVYPELAKIGHVQGEVLLSIVISSEGRVVDMKLLSGPPLLIQAAEDAVKQWEYRPYLLQGSAQAVITVVHVKFALPDVPETVQYPEDAYNNQESLCKGLLDLKDFYEAEPACALLPGLAEKVDTMDSIKDQENAYRYAGLAYYQVARYQDAATAWQHQLEIARNNDSPSDVGWVHSTVALALAGAGDLSGAGANWEQARNILEAAHQQSPDDADVSDRLGRVLTAYAKLLRRTGDSAKAEALEKEAVSLNN